MLSETIRAVAIPFLSVVVPLGGLLGLVKLREHRLKGEGTREPFEGKLLRPPGESLRRELDVLNDSVNETLVGIITGSLLFVCITTSLYYQGQPPVGPVAWTVYGLCALGGYGYACRGYFRLLEERRRKRLGYRGERVVGEHLNQLLLEGWWVFHDVPTDRVTAATASLVAHVAVPTTAAPCSTAATLKVTPSRPEAASGRIYSSGGCST